MKKTFPLIIASLIYADHALALSDSQVADLTAKLTADSAQRSEGATSGYAQLIGFISDSSVSGYVLDVDNDLGSKINIIKLPLDKELATFGDMGLSIRGGFNYATVDSKNILDGLSSDQIKPESEAYSGLLGLMLKIPLSKRWSLSPTLDAGVGRIENTLNFQGADALQVQPLVNSLVINWSTNVVLVTSGLKLDYRQAFENFTLDVKSNYDHTVISSFSESNNFGGFTKQTDLLHFLVDLSHPLGINAFGFPLTGVVHEDNLVFLGDNNQALGFSNLNAFGYRVESDFSKAAWKISSLALGFNYLLGDQVEGYEIVFNAGF